MAPAEKLYPRATVKRIIKAHSAKNLSKNVDVLIFLNYSLFLKDLIREAAIAAKKRGDKRIASRDISRASRDVLQKYKG